MGLELELFFLFGLWFGILIITKTQLSTTSETYGFNRRVDPSNGGRSRQADQRCPQQDVPAGSCSYVACQGDARTACTVRRAATEQIADHRLFSERLQTRRRFCPLSPGFNCRL